VCPAHPGTFRAFISYTFAFLIGSFEWAVNGHRRKKAIIRLKSVLFYKISCFGYPAHSKILHLDFGFGNFGLSQVKNIPPLGYFIIQTIPY